MISALVSIDSDSELASLDTLLDDDIVTDDRVLCSDELLSGVDLRCSDRTASSVRLHDDGVADERRLESVDRVATGDIVGSWYFDSDFLYEEVGSVLVYAKRMYHKR
jgi:hypothetical protein